MADALRSRLGSLGIDRRSEVDDLDLDALGRLPGGRLDVLTASLAMNILALALPIVILQTYDRIIPNDARETLVLLVLGVGCALLLDAALRICRSYITGWAAARFQFTMTQRSVSRLLNAKLLSVEKDPPGVQLDRLNALDTLRDFYSGHAMLTLIDLPFAILFLALIAYLAGPLVLVPIGLLAAFAAFAWVTGNRLRKALRERSTIDDRRYSFIIEALTGIHTIKGLGMEALMTRRYERLQASCAEAGYDVNMTSAQAQSVSALFSQATMILVAGFGSLIVIDGGLTMGGLAACTLLAGRSLQPLIKAMGVWTQFQSIRVARDNVRMIYQLEPEAAQDRPAMPEIDGAVQLEGMTFGYDPAKEPLLEDVDLDVAAGDTVGICGDNGAGKSTLMWLIMGLLEPQAGVVRLGGYDRAEFDPRSIRRQIAYVPQNGFLFQGSILDNLTAFGGPEREDLAMDLAAKLGLDEVVARMPQGYQTRVGNTSFDAIPQGIRQRISIARALIAQPRIILFDEANSSLDGAGDTRIRKLLTDLKGDATIFIVSHRPSLLRLADRIFDIRERKLHPRPSLEQPTDNPVVAMHFPA